MLRACQGLWTSFGTGGYLSSTASIPQILCPAVFSFNPSLLAPRPSAVNVVTQRWKYRTRKLFGAPRSRKKRYYVRVPTPRVPEEMSELYWRYSHYRTEMRALREHFAQWKVERYPAESMSSSANFGASKTLSTPASTIDEEFAEAVRLNNEINEKNAAKRDARREQELEYRMAERQDVLMHMQREEFEEETKFEQLVEKKKEVVANLVTPENFSERLEYAMDNPVDFNFCIGLNGRMTRGRPDPLNKINMHHVPKDELAQTPQENNVKEDYDNVDEPTMSAKL